MIFSILSWKVYISVIRTKKEGLTEVVTQLGAHKMSAIVGNLQ